MPASASTSIWYINPLGHRVTIAVDTIPNAGEATALIGAGKAALHAPSRQVKDLKQHRRRLVESQEVVGNEKIVVDPVVVGRKDARRRANIVDQRIVLRRQAHGQGRSRRARIHIAWLGKLIYHFAIGRRSPFVECLNAESGSVGKDARAKKHLHKTRLGIHAIPKVNGKSLTGVDPRSKKRLAIFD